MKKVETIDIGDSVVCDICNEDYTGSDEPGGFLFSLNGVCPKCAPRFEKSAREFNEEGFITARALPGESFWHFILRMRGGDNTVTITTLEK